MKQYIDKDALVAEIERLQMDKGRVFNEYDAGFSEGRISVFDNILSFLNTLEVKEVDFEKEIDKFYGMYRKNGQTFLLEDNEECVDWKEICNPEFETAFAKHFFKLGLKAQKGE